MNLLVRDVMGEPCPGIATMRAEDLFYLLKGHMAEDRRMTAIANRVVNNLLTGPYGVNPETGKWGFHHRKSLGEVASMTDADLLAIRGVGRATLPYVRYAIQERQGHE